MPMVLREVAGQKTVGSKVPFVRGLACVAPRVSRSATRDPVRNWMTSSSSLETHLLGETPLQLTLSGRPHGLDVRERCIDIFRRESILKRLHLRRVRRVDLEDPA